MALLMQRLLPSRFRRPLLAGLMALMALPAAPAHAQGVDELIEGAKLCTRNMPRIEKSYGIPMHLLSAISSTESGRWHNGLKIAIPWPWTINAEGKGYYFKSKEEAISNVRRLQAQGVKSIDVGCMQVNLYHHPDAFTDLRAAFEPETNITYAATFLRDLYASEGTWRKAAAAYHSRTAELGTPYAGMVYNRWNTILDRLRIARSQVAVAEAMPAPAGMAYKQAQADGKPSPMPRSKMVQLAGDIPAGSPAARLAEQLGKPLPRQKMVRMNSIEVGDAKPKRENGVLVVRVNPPKAPEMELAQLKSAGNASATLTDISAPAPVSAPQPKIVRLNAASAPAVSPRQQGPRFIFD